MPHLNTLHSSFFLRNVLFKNVSFQRSAIKNILVDTFVEAPERSKTLKFFSTLKALES